MIDVKQINPFILPSVSLMQRDQLPKVEAIYFAILGMEILYIGQSVNLQQRWQSHHRSDQLKSYDNVVIAWLSIADSEEHNLGKLEEACINHFKPTLNRTTFLDENGQGKKMGRPSRDCVKRAFTLDRSVVEYIDALPDGSRSKFVNRALSEAVRSYKAQ